MLPGWPSLSSSSLDCVTCFWLLNDLHCPQLGAARRRVLPDFLLPWRKRLLCQNRRPPRPLQLPETLFDLSVLQRHEGDDDDPATWLHHQRRAIEQRVELLLLAIHNH